MASSSQLLNLKEVSQRVKLKKSAIYAHVRDGRFPAPLRISRRAIRWKEAEVENYVSSLPRTNELKQPG